ncbi:MAG: hypothetical protein OEV07_15640, partial [Gammaproteobacteria bacterium]|nr:hypothetical protein [Gammaproteobacteria bacterium]
MHRLLSCLVPLLLLGCSQGAPVSLANSAEQRDDGWTTATLEASGFDVGKIRQLNQRLETGWHPNAHILLVEYDGKLVYEKYLAGKDESWGISIG